MNVETEQAALAELEEAFRFNDAVLRHPPAAWTPPRQNSPLSCVSVIMTAVRVAVTMSSGERFDRDEDD